MKILPNEITLLPGKKWRFSINSEDKNNKVVWSVLEGEKGGTISQEAIYNAPKAEGNYTIAASNETGSQTKASIYVTEDTDRISIHQVAGLAEQIYNAIDQEEMEYCVSQLFEWLEIPVLSIDRGFEEIKSKQLSGELFVTDVLIQELAKGLLARHMITLDSMVKFLNDKGVTTIDTNLSLTVEYFTERFSSIRTEGPLTEYEVVPSLILALTQQRLKVNSLKDGVWGDRLLDNLQSSLIIFGFLGLKEEENI
jgi:hypothetical protein